MKVKLYTNDSEESLENKKAIELKTSEFFIEIENAYYRFGVEKDGISICLINGVDCKIVQRHSYPAIKLTHARFKKED